MSWPPALQAALDEALPYTGGTHRQVDIEIALASGMMQLWEGDRCFCLTELHTAPSGLKFVNLFLAGGEDLAGLQQMYPYIEGWAQSQGAAKIVCLGRYGWEKTFLTKEEGFRPLLQYYEKDLGGPHG